jgi:hypothetical protein
VLVGQLGSKSLWNCYTTQSTYASLMEGAVLYNIAMETPHNFLAPAEIITSSSNFFQLTFGYGFQIVGLMISS